jgi:uncharacterized membrane protein YeiB
VLDRLSGFLEKEQETRNKVKSAMTYPVVVFCFAMLMVFALLMFVLPVGLVTNIAWAILGIDMISSGASVNPTFLLGMMLLAVGGPTLALSYICLAVLITRSEWGARLLSPLAPVGQMALTNYLIQSLVCTLIFYGYGLGLFGQMGMAAGIGLTIARHIVEAHGGRIWAESAGPGQGSAFHFTLPGA